MLGICVGGCGASRGGATSPQPLAEYTQYNNGERANGPEGYIAFLRRTRFTHGELDHLPPFAVIFHGDPERYFGRIGLAKSDWAAIELGTTDPSLLYVVRPPGRAAFMVNRGLPGAGGIATQSAELIALGARYLVHIGTSGLLGTAGSEDVVVLSDAAYRDGGAVLLAPSDDRKFSRLSYPDRELSQQLFDVLAQDKVPAIRSVGYTIPIYYYQSSGLIRALLGGPTFSNPRPRYLEMEEAAFYETAKRGNAKAASLTVGADRYIIEQGALRHTFAQGEAVSRTIASALRASADLFDAVARSRDATTLGGR